MLSNRLPFTYERSDEGIVRRPSAGGLVSALEPALQRRGGTWIGWPGIALEHGEKLPHRTRKYGVSPVRIDPDEVEAYYYGFSNRTLWPLFHSLPGHARYDRDDWEAYQTVNERFAEAAYRHAATAGLVWINDYHLMVAPEFLRHVQPEVRQAFFLHIPFPPYDVFRMCPWDRELLRGLLACDLIGFHVEGYVMNFLDCAERILGARVDRERNVIEHGDRLVRVGSFPIGIEFEDFEQMARKAPASEGRPAQRMVLGVDRLDYTKGIPERILAFERLLERHPDQIEKVVLFQVAVPSRAEVAEYQDLKREIDELVGRVNGRFATPSWSPIRYLYRGIPRDELCALYRDADVALITPLRDGMNLVAKEYVACQTADPGVLVLSQMAGAAETMREALVVNPFSIDETAEALHRALTMDEAERTSRINALRRRERRDNVQAWAERFIETASIKRRASITPLGDGDLHQWLAPFVKQYRVCLFLDYDGTLTPIRDHPSKAKLRRSMREALESCSTRRDTDVAIVSGRALDDVRKMVGDPELVYAGNHGLEVEGPNLDPFRHEDLIHYVERAQQLADALKEVEADGAWTEAKGPTLTFHYRQVEPTRRARLIERARQLMTDHGYQARDAHAAVEARPPIGWDKGRAVLHMLREWHGPAWSERVRVIYVGDDRTDEDAFRFLAGLALTFRVGAADTPTDAVHRLPNVDAVEKLLGWVGRRPSRSRGRH